MAYVIAQPCIGVKDTVCVVVCPVDCIHPTPQEPAFAGVDQLFIDPNTCIDCNLCLSECPVDAIFAEADVPSEWAEFVARNAAYFQATPLTPEEIQARREQNSRKFGNSPEFEK